MDLSRVKEILTKRKYQFDKDSGEEVDDVTYKIYNGKGEDDYVEVGYITSTEKVIEIFVSNSCYSFGNDENDRRGICLGGKSEYKIDEELFIYCLDIQKYPGLHEINMCRDYLKFSKWRQTELNPVLENLDFQLYQDICEIDDTFFPFIISYTYEGDRYNVFLEINPLTRKVELHVSNTGGTKVEDLSSLVGEPSDIIFGALEGFAVSRPSNP
jgi:hypothetical protein